MSERVQFVLCADDYGLTPAISQGIRKLLEMGRISATSCLVTSQHWQTEGPALRSLSAKADLGLHLALTQLKPLGKMPRLAATGRLPSLKGLITLAFAGRLDAVEIGNEMDRQLDAFE